MPFINDHLAPAGLVRAMGADAQAMKIVLFGTWSRLSLLAFEALATHGLVVAVVLSGPRRRGLRDLLPLFRPRSPLESAARARMIPVIRLTAANEPAVAERLCSLRPDLICIATFRRLLSREITALAPLGAINLHPSLLPRYRGPLPLFWTYYADDRMSGVTVHHASQVFDAGDIILQESFPLPRAYPATKLIEDVGQRGAALLRSAVQALACGQAPRVVQDERAATVAPLVRPGVPMVRFDEWDVERVWHFLAGLSPRFREPLTDGEGRPVLYRRVIGFERRRSKVLGSVEPIAGGWNLHCRGGVVLLGSCDVA
jgi:methionyl-tRNA formyltransferase